LKTASLLSALALVASAAALSGCMGPGGDTGTLSLYLSDEENAIGDFRHLNLTVSEVKYKVKGQDNRSVSSINKVFDLTTLQGDNMSKIMDAEAPVGEIERIDIFITKAEGVLLNGTTVQVNVPSGRLFLKDTDLKDKGATIEKGATTEFIFDATVVKEGNGGYKLKPNASASGKPSAMTGGDESTHSPHAAHGDKGKK